MDVAVVVAAAFLAAAVVTVAVAVVAVVAIVAVVAVAALSGLCVNFVPAVGHRPCPPKLHFRLVRFPPTATATTTRRFPNVWPTNYSSRRNCC